MRRKSPLHRHVLFWLAAVIMWWFILVCILILIWLRRIP